MKSENYKRNMLLEFPYSPYPFFFLNDIIMSCESENYKRNMLREFPYSPYPFFFLNDIIMSCEDIQRNSQCYNKAL